jgi:hypothetical protein
LGVTSDGGSDTSDLRQRWLKSSYGPAMGSGARDSLEAAVLTVSVGPDRTTDWLKFKNPHAPAVRREAEEDWGNNA